MFTLTLINKQKKRKSKVSCSTIFFFLRKDISRLELLLQLIHYVLCLCCSTDTKKVYSAVVYSFDFQVLAPLAEKVLCSSYCCNINDRLPFFALILSFGVSEWVLHIFCSAFSFAGIVALFCVAVVCNFFLVAKFMSLRFICFFSSFLCTSHAHAQFSIHFAFTKHSYMAPTGQKQSERERKIENWIYDNSQ